MGKGERQTTSADILHGHYLPPGHRVWICRIGRRHAFVAVYRYTKGHAFDIDIAWSRGRYRPTREAGGHVIASRHQYTG